MRFLNEFERMPTEAVIQVGSAILSLDIQSSVDHEQLDAIGLVLLRRIETAMSKIEKRPSFEEVAATPMGVEWIEGFTDAKYNVTEAIRQLEAAL